MTRITIDPRDKYPKTLISEYKMTIFFMLEFFKLTRKSQSQLELIFTAQSLYSDWASGTSILGGRWGTTTPPPTLTSY